MRGTLKIRRVLLPLAVCAVVLVVHFCWLGLFPERDPAQDRWAAPAMHLSWWRQYVEGRSYWLGFSYGFSLAFAAVAWRRYREGRFCPGRKVAIGGVTFSGVLSVIGCYLLGCCGSPMLAVYLSLFGAAFVPLAGPLLAGLTLLSVLVGWWWMNRHTTAGASSADCGCGEACSPSPRVTE